MDDFLQSGLWKPTFSMRIASLRTTSQQEQRNYDDDEDDVYVERLPMGCALLSPAAVAVPTKADRFHIQLLPIFQIVC